MIRSHRTRGRYRWINVLPEQKSPVEAYRTAGDLLMEEILSLSRSLDQYPKDKVSEEISSRVMRWLTRIAPAQLTISISSFRHSPLP